MSLARAPGRWLVTGAGGQLGRSLLAVAAARDLELVGLDRSALDVTDAGRVRDVVEELAPDVVVNAAAFTAVDRCESESEAAMRINGHAPGLLAQACAGRALLIHVSTDYVFPGTTARILDEDACPEPRSAYGRSKLRGEQAVREAGGEHVVVRTSWLFGPGANFVRSILARVRAGEPLRVVVDEVGRPTWTGTLARALLEVPERSVRGTLHLANEGQTSRHAFAREIVREAVYRGWADPSRADPDRIERITRADLSLPAERPAHAVLGLERAHAAGFELPHWCDALSDYLDAEEENRDA